MDYVPPPIPAYEIAHTQSEAEKKFRIPVEHAIYNQDKMKATININDALQNSHKIESYTGEWITLVYQNNESDFLSCPIVEVPLEDISRNIDYLHNEVSLTVSNISETLAGNIEDSACLMIDTYTVKKVSNPDFDTEKKKYN